jgi:hypothetical protein
MLLGVKIWLHNDRNLNASVVLFLLLSYISSVLTVTSIIMLSRELKKIGKKKVMLLHHVCCDCLCLMNSSVQMCVYK